MFQFLKTKRPEPRPAIEPVSEPAPPPTTANRKFSTLTTENLSAVNDAQKNDFNVRKAEMGGDTLMEIRLASYLLRWKEALAYTKPGDCLLDIGGGWVSDAIFSRIVADSGVNYHIIDIDRKVIAAALQKLMAHSLPLDNAKISHNASIPFNDASFDFVFSSHCLEHSIDMSATFSEIHRVLQPNGLLFFAVPIGFDDSDEHNYFFDIDEWAALAVAGGFDLHGIRPGRFYNYPYWDLTVIAKKTDAALDLDRINAISRRSCKGGKTIILPADPAFQFSPPTKIAEDNAQLVGVGAKCVFSAKEKLANLLVLKNEYTNVIEITDGKSKVIVDCYSTVPHIAAIDISTMKAPLTVSVVSKSHHSRSDVAAIYGALVVE